MCLAEEVLEFNIKEVFAEETCIKIYFPYLYNNSVLNLDAFLSRRQDFLIKNEKLIDDNFRDRQATINLFYNLSDKSTEIDYLERGIKSIEFIIHPLIKFNIPLDVIFKLIHAEKKIPLIKFNPGKNQENIYRLYANKISKDGRKIPYLSKGTIFRLIKAIGRLKRVSIYIEYYRDTDNNETDNNQTDNNQTDNKLRDFIPIICDIDSNASLYISIDLKESYDFDLGPLR